MEEAIVFRVARLESDNYSVPRGAYCIGKYLKHGWYEVTWLPPHNGSSCPVWHKDLIEAGEFIIPDRFWRT